LNESIGRGSERKPSGTLAETCPVFQPRNLLKFREIKRPIILPLLRPGRPPAKEVAQRLFEAAKKGITARGWERFTGLKIRKLRVSGCEPTLGKEHLLQLLERIEGSGYQFYLETNGILLGADRDYVRKLSGFSKFIYVRVSFKAATPEGFTLRTGVLGEYYDLPFKALKHLLDEGIYARAAAMTDPKVMPREERRILPRRLEEIDPSAEYSKTLEKERVDAYDTTIKRLKASADLEFAKQLEKILTSQ